MTKELTENQRAYLKLIIEERESEDIGWREAEKRVRKYGEEELRRHGIDGKYPEQPRDLRYEIDGKSGGSGKADEVPERLESLIEDIELLQEAGIWKEYWDELLDVDPDEDVDFRLGRDMLECESPQEEFGSKLGKMVGGLFTLFPDTDQVDPHLFRYGLIRGFISGFYQSTVFDIDEIPVDSDFYKTPATLEEDMKTTKKIHRERQTLDKDLPFRTGRIRLWYLHLEESVDNYIKTILRSNWTEVKLTEGSITEVDRGHPDYDALNRLAKYVRKALEEKHYHGCSLSTVAAMENPSCVGGGDESTRKSLLRYIKAEYATPDKIISIVDEKDLEVVSVVDEYVRDDLDRLFNPDETPTPEVVPKVPMEGATVKEISEKSGLEELVVARTVRYLAGDSVGGKKWGSYDIVSISRKGGEFEWGKWEVSLTPYGRLISRQLDAETMDRIEEIREKENEFDREYARPWEIPPTLFMDIPADLLYEVVKQLSEVTSRPSGCRVCFSKEEYESILEEVRSESDNSNREN